MSANPSVIEPEMKPEIVPFWNRLREIILYPAHGASMANIVVLALATLVIFFPFKIMALILLLLVSVAMYRYAFECLRATANGQLTPPEGGFLSTTDKSLGWKLIGLLFIIGVVAGIGIGVLGPRLGIVWVLFLGLCMPAAVMVLAMDESIGAAINPGKWFSIIGRIGWSYLAVVGLCLAVLMSEGFGQNMAAKVLPLAVALVVVSLISNYCLVVMFHLMGYLLYQYHEDVGFVPDAPQTLQRPLAQMDPDQELLDRASAMVRDGRPEDATMLLGGRLKASGGTMAVHAQYRKLLNLAGDKDELLRHGQEFLGVLLAQEKDKQALDLLRECQALDPNFAPGEPSQITRLAEKAAAWGQPQVALKLLGGFHKRFPKSKDIPRNYLLAATMMFERMNQDAQACALLRSLKTTYPDDPLMPQIDAKLAEIERMMAMAKSPAKAKPVTPA
jgi:tetratricopeptide (TPR) repeat protein